MSEVPLQVLGRRVGADARAMLGREPQVDVRSQREEERETGEREK